MIGLEGKTVMSPNVNGDSHEVMVRPSDLLLDVLREQLGLTNAKAGCKNGDYGACTVMVDDWPAKSCLMLAVEAQDKKITTVEGFGGKTAVQKAFVEADAFQCGYYTSGFLIVCHALMMQRPIMSDEIVMEEWLRSNLCHCTSYQEIRKATHLIYDSLQGTGI